MKAFRRFRQPPPDLYLRLDRLDELVGALRAIEGGQRDASEKTAAVEREIAALASTIAQLQETARTLSEGLPAPLRDPAAFRQYNYGGWISYAQVLEDIHLLRALREVEADAGFYIDVGAGHPEIDSVTKLFYDAGWHGINIEPSPTWFPYFLARRPRDINLNVAVSDQPGTIPFYNHPDGGLGTTVEYIVDAHAAAGHMRKEATVVPAVTLTEICDRYAPGAIHFLKIDVEGAEASVLRSLDFNKYRPWLLCIESHFPLRLDIQTYKDWEEYIGSRGYRFVYTDRVNRYYVADEHKERAAAFAVPADFYIPAALIRRLRDLES